jgi:hypothetical protein
MPTGRQKWRFGMSIGRYVYKLRFLSFASANEEA